MRFSAFLAVLAVALSLTFKWGLLGIAAGWAVAYAVEHPGPIYLRLTRQNLEPVHDGYYNLIDWLLGCLMVYMCLFGIGKIVLEEYRIGLIFLVISATSGLVIYWDFSRRGWEKLSGKA